MPRRPAAEPAAPPRCPARTTPGQGAAGPREAPRGHRSSREILPPTQQPLQRDPSACPSLATADHRPLSPQRPRTGAPPPTVSTSKASSSPPSAQGPGAPVLPRGDCRGQGSPSLFLQAPQARHSCPPTLEPTQQPTAWSTALPRGRAWPRPVHAGGPAQDWASGRAGGVGGS